jgi:hypothetical protein
MAASELNVQPQVAQACAKPGARITIGTMRANCAARGTIRPTKRGADGAVNPRRGITNFFMASPERKRERTGATRPTLSRRAALPCGERWIESGESRRSARSLVAGGSEISVYLCNLWQQWLHTWHRRCAQHRERRQWRRSRTLRIGTGRIGLGVMMPRMIVTAMMMNGPRRIRIAQNDFKSPVDRREHEACGHERAKAEHREDERRSPVACATVP